MKLSVKAALLSGLLYPGAGFFLMKRYGLVVLFALPATLAIGYVMYYVMEIARDIAERIDSGHIATDVMAIRAAITEALAEENTLFSWAKISFVIFWLGSVPLSYWLGAREEQAAANAVPH